jgi:hypothetical protein
VDTSYSIVVLLVVKLKQPIQELGRLYFPCFRRDFITLLARFLGPPNIIALVV